ncbi:MAG: hypothetical protein LBQ38_11215, partial [Spirochaetaceae bacterium]|nr:hypothetical protein [Spirochaetaceae bacterium]
MAQNTQALRGLSRIRNAARIVLGLFLGGILASCAGTKPALRREQSAPGLPVEAAFLPEEISGTFDRVIQKVKTNSGDIKKYFLQDDDSNILVLADLTEDGEAFEVRYDVGGAVPGAEDYRLDFTVTRKNTGA